MLCSRLNGNGARILGLDDQRLLRLGESAACRVGLALTILAIVQATGAKRAATEAREAIYQRNAADALAETVRLAEQCVEYLLLERPSEASVRARDLVLRIPRDRARFDRFLTGDSGKLREAESVFQRLVIRLSSFRFFEDNDEARAEFDAVLESSRGLSAVHGRLLARLDKERS